MKNIVCSITVVALACVSVSAQPVLAEEKAEAATEQAKKPKKIKDRRHPDYVRCRSEPIIGSLARKRRVCMTNREWAEVARKGNETTRDMINDHQVLMQPSN